MKMRHRRKQFWFFVFCEFGEPECKGYCNMRATTFMRAHQRKVKL